MRGGAIQAGIPDGTVVAFKGSQPGASAVAQHWRAVLARAHKKDAVGRVPAQPNAHHRPAVPMAHDRRRGPPLLVPHPLQGNRHRCSKPRASRGTPLRMASARSRSSWIPKLRRIVVPQIPCTVFFKSSRGQTSVVSASKALRALSLSRETEKPLSTGLQR